MYHPRAGEQRWNPRARDAYVRYKYLTIMYGPDKRNLKRYQQVHGNFSYWMMRSSSVIGYVPVLLPTKEEGKMYLDLTFPIRGIFFPLAQKAAAKFPTMCKYVRLDFKRLPVKIPYEMNEEQKRVAQIARSMEREGIAGLSDFGMLGGMIAKNASNITPKTTSEGPEPLDKYNALCLPQNVEFGLNYQPKWTIEFDVVPLVILLAIPRKDRHPDDDPYKYLRAIEAMDVRTPLSVTLSTNMEDENYADLAQVLKVTQGVSFEYDKAEDLNFLPDLLNGLVAIGLSCIPLIGPLISCAEQMAYDAIINPDKFSGDNDADLTNDVIGAIFDTALEAKDHLNIGKVSKGITRNSKKVQFKTIKPLHKPLSRL
ncbi:MAG: hypothetical protein Q9198_001917 [Flavoplaca austrocitrina]